MKKPAKDIKEGAKINVAGRSCVVKKTEFSDIGKHGKKKCRIEATTDSGEKIVLIRPEDYPLEEES